LWRDDYGTSNSSSNGSRAASRGPQSRKSDGHPDDGVPTEQGVTSGTRVLRYFDHTPIKRKSVWREYAAAAAVSIRLVV